MSGLTYEWLKNGTLISGELSLTLVLSVGPNDGGTYTCRVSNRVGQGEASAPVEVIGERLGVSVAMVTRLFVSVLSMSTCA